MAGRRYISYTAPARPTANRESYASHPALITRLDTALIMLNKLPSYTQTLKQFLARINTDYCYSWCMTLSCLSRLRPHQPPPPRGFPSSSPTEPPAPLPLSLLLIDLRPAYCFFSSPLSGFRANHQDAYQVSYLPSVPPSAPRQSRHALPSTATQ